MSLEIQMRSRSGQGVQSSPMAHCPAGTTAAVGSPALHGSSGGGAVASLPALTVVTLAPVAVSSFVEVAAISALRCLGLN